MDREMGLLFYQTLLRMSCLFETIFFMVKAKNAGISIDMVSQSADLGRYFQRGDKENRPQMKVHFLSACGIQ